MWAFNLRRKEWTHLDCKGLAEVKYARFEHSTTLVAGGMLGASHAQTLVVVGGVSSSYLEVLLLLAAARCCWLLLSAATCSEAGAAAGSAACKGCVCALGGRKPPADSVGWRAAGGMASCVTSLLEAKANVPFLF